jgi:eukaryotic-like serine/threonine-protein kinase
MTPGTRLGPYEILSPIGAGGMGAVYRARDTKLGRDVAVKVLPAALAADPVRLARFQREAQVLASLNHPNIAAIYGVEDRALILELVEGEAPKGPLPMEEALALARQLADAMEYAHERGVVHRDLKPANIMVTPRGQLKVLDFGLAKVMAEEDSAITMDSATTKLGAILGTPAYMSPEQASGRPADKRADIWSFGVVLFELLTGKRPFGEGTVTEQLATLLTQEPDWELAPREVRRLLKRCLEKDPKRRLRDIGDAWELLGSGTETAAAGAASKLPWLLCGIASLLTIALAGALIWNAGWFRARPIPLGAAAFEVPPPEGTALWGGGATPNIAAPNLAVSPDGKSIVFAAMSEGNLYLWLQALDSPAAQRLTPTNADPLPFWSPDGKWIAFFDRDRLKRIPITGGAPVLICPVDSVHEGGAWGSDGTVIFSGPGGLKRVAAAGGDPSPETHVDASSGERHQWPQFLPDGRHFLYLSTVGGVGGGDVEKSAVYVGELGLNHRVRVLKSSTRAVYASGHLLFVGNGRVFAQPFDAGRLVLRGAPVPVTESINVTRVSDRVPLSASENGVLAYRAGDASSFGLGKLTWFDRTGRNLGTMGDSAVYSNPAFSPDGQWLAVDIGERGSRDIWLFDLARGTPQRVTSDPADDVNPVWSADTKRLAFTSNRRGKREIYVKNPFGAAAEEVFLPADSSGEKSVTDWSADGRWIAWNHYGNDGVWMGSVETRKSELLVAGPATHGRFSPDGKWVAYDIEESGRRQVYVQPFPATGARWQISVPDGVTPAWRTDGKELYYSSSDANSPSAGIVAVDIAVKNGAIQASAPHTLFSSRTTSLGRNNWLPTPNGQKFLVIVPVERPPVDQLLVIHNWPALLEKR